MCQLPVDPADGPGDRAERSARSARRRRARRGRRCRWGSSPAGRSSRPSARRSTAATASSAATSSGPATGAGPTTTATRRARRSTVHRAAGLIDVSTLGKLLVAGPDAGEFLDRLYPNRFSNLEPGRIRYGVITSDAGRIIDDGTICRLDDETFYVTTTSSGAGAVEEWFSWWLADWGMSVRLTDVTQGLSAVNLAGPAGARDHGAGSPTSTAPTRRSRYLDGKQAQVAGVPCLILRIGFVGEVGYEIHFPAAYGEHLWDALLEAGRAARDPAVRARAAADPAPAEAAHHRRPGHRLRVDAVRRGDAVDRQARQGGGLHRQVGARALRARSRRRRRWSASRWPTATCRPRARS